MADRENIYVTLEDTTVTAGILIGITQNFFRVPELATKYDDVSRTAFRWTYLKRKPRLGTIAKNLAIVKELATDVKFSFDNEKWYVKIHRDLYEDIVDDEGVPDTTMGWSVYSGDNSKAGNLINHVQSDSEVDKDVAIKKVHLPPETPTPLTKVVENRIPDLEANSSVRDGPKTVEDSNSGPEGTFSGRDAPETKSDDKKSDKNSLPDADGIPTPRHQSETPIMNLLIVDRLKNPENYGFDDGFDDGVMDVSGHIKGAENESVSEDTKKEINEIISLRLQEKQKETNNYSGKINPQQQIEHQNQL